jgi:hypothetical protein
MIHVLNDKAIAVDVHPESYNHTIVDNELWLVARGGLSARRYFCDLPEGTWQILGRPNDFTEAIWGGLVAWFELAGKVGYMDYSFEDPRFPFSFAKDSGLSLLKSKNISPDNVIILIKQ